MQTLASHQGGIDSLIVGNGFLEIYWSGGNGGEVRECPSDGSGTWGTDWNGGWPKVAGGVTTAYNGAYWNLYWWAPSGILTCTGSCDQFGPEVVVNEPQSSDSTRLVSDGSNVFWVGGGLNKLDAKTKVKTTLVSQLWPYTSIQSLTTDGTNVYLVAYQFTSGVVEACSVNGCNDQPQILTATNHPGWVAADGQSAYWSDGPAIVQCAVAGCASPNIIVPLSPSDEVEAVAVDATNVYWGTQDHLSEMPKGGGQEHVIAYDMQPRLVVVGGDYVYWVSGEEIRRAHK